MIGATTTVIDPAEAHALVDELARRAADLEHAVRVEDAAKVHEANARRRLALATTSRKSREDALAETRAQLNKATGSHWQLFDELTAARR